MLTMLTDRQLGNTCTSVLRIRDAPHSTGGDIIGIADAQHLTAGDTGVAGHHRDADGQADIAQALTQDRAQKHSQDQHGHSHHSIHDTHDEGIHTPPAMPAIRPSAMPITLEMTTATIPTVKEMRAP